MSAGHFELLPAVALQLVLEVEAYRAAVSSLVANPGDELQRTRVTRALRAASPLAHAVPAAVAAWGNLTVAHNEFTLARMRAEPATVLSRMAAHVDACAEAVVAASVKWALRQQAAARVPPHTIAAFRAWDTARRDAFAAAHFVAALLAAGAPVPPQLREHHQRAAGLAALLLDDASRALFQP